MHRSLRRGERVVEVDAVLVLPALALVRAPFDPDAGLGQRMAGAPEGVADPAHQFLGRVPLAVRQNRNEFIHFCVKATVP